MNLEELKKRILNFRSNVQDFYELLGKSRSRALPKIVRNHEKIARFRTLLNSEYGKLEKFLKHFGNYPSMRDGVNAVSYPAYSNAFSGDILQRVGPSIRAVLQDLDIISGKLSNLTEEELEQAMTPRQAKAEHLTDTKSGTNLWKTTNPVWLVWKFLCWSWQHKLLGVLALAVGLLAIDYSLAWKNFIWLKNFLSTLF